MRVEAPPLLSWSEASSQLGRNLSKATRYMIPNMLNNTRRLNVNALIVASLVLVISRIIVANMSALKAKGTEEGAYRYQQSIRTTLREVGGWTLSFAVLRQFQNIIGLGMKKAYGIKERDPSVPPTFLSEVSKNLKAFVHRQPLNESIRWIESAEERTFSYQNNKISRATVNLLRKVPGLAQKEAKTLIQGTYNWAPILIGSIPSIILSGFVLEALTRDKSDQVVNAVSRMFHHKNQANTAPNPAEAAPPPGFSTANFNGSLQGQVTGTNARPINVFG
jgi:hypothetical protein